jgi:hypothetical protein
MCVRRWKTQLEAQQVAIVGRVYFAKASSQGQLARGLPPTRGDHQSVCGRGEGGMHVNVQGITYLLGLLPNVDLEMLLPSVDLTPELPSDRCEPSLELEACWKC